MVGLDEMRKLMHYDVFDALDRLIDQVQIEVECSLFEITASPAAFHGMDANGLGRYDELPLLIGQGQIKGGKARQDHGFVAILNDLQQAFLLGVLLGDRRT